MAKDANKVQDVMAMALAATMANTVKGRGGSGKTTYLDRFVDCLLDENGEPTAPKSRTQIIAEITYAICVEKREEAIADGLETAAFTLTEKRDTDDDAEFAATNQKVKAQVASAIAKNNNSTSVSYNPKYKDVWSVGKDGKNVFLVAVPAAE